MVKQFRNIVTTTLKKRTTPKNAEILEKAIYDCMVKLKDEYGIEDLDDSDFAELYKEHSYNFLGIIMDESVSLKNTLDDLKNKNVGWDCHVYSEYVAKRETENIRATRPTDITDGLHKCRKCGCRKIIMYSLQLRSSDEPMTNFFICTQCGQKWKQG